MHGLFIRILTNRLKSIWMQPKSKWALVYGKKEHLQPMIAENQIWQPQQKESAYPLPKSKQIQKHSFRKTNCCAHGAYNLFIL
jgi:hypothetical protein